jgi:calcium-dependent protein kinase
LGKGKFGVVCSAVHLVKNKKVAVKMLKKATMKPLDIELVKREIEVLKLCQHPNIIRLYDLFENEAYIYIVMELLQEDLYTYLEKRKFKQSEARACSIIHSLACAIYYFHSYGVVHRDLKLDNIMMIDETEDSDVKVVDFGLSKIICPGETSTEPYGTLGYAAPEVLERKPYGKEADIWGLGIVTYILLTGLSPFEDNSESEIIRKTINENPSFIHECWKPLSEAAREFTKRIS